MKNTVINILKFVVFLSLGILLFWLVYRDKNFDDILKVVAGADLIWIWISIGIGVISHISRAVRWNMLIRPLGFSPRLPNTIFAVLIGYMANLFLPRMGEVVRCGVLKKSDNIPLSNLFGTVVLERTIDVLMLLLLLGFVILSQADEMLLFLDNNPDVKKKLLSIVGSKYVIISGITLVVLLGSFLFFFRKKIAKSALYKKISGFITNFWLGIKSVRKLKNRGWFLFHTIFIYVGYYFMFYICIFCFEETSQIAPIAGLTIFVMSGLGMVAPVQAGIGAWHFMVIQGLIVYGVSDDIGGAFALLVHSSMTIFMLGAGVVSLAGYYLYNRNNKPILSPDIEANNE